MHRDVCRYFPYKCPVHLASVASHGVLDAELKHRLNASATFVVHNKMLIVARCRGRSAI